MSRRAVGYNPSSLLRAKRARVFGESEDVAKKALGAALPSLDDKDNSNSPMHVFDDADSFLENIRPKISQMLEMIAEMKKLADASTNSGVSDDDRKGLNGKFVERRREVGRLTEETEFKGKHLFTGDLMKSALKLRVGHGELDVIEVRFEPLKNDVTGLEGQKIDSIVSARKAQKELTEIAARFSLAAMMMKAKEDAINLKRKQFIEENNIPEEVANASKAKAMREVARKRQELQRLSMHIDLKEEQERRAEYEGRERALLINRKI